MLSSNLSLPPSFGRYPGRMFTVYGYDNNPRTRIVKIVAAAENIPITQSEVVPRKNINKASYMVKFPMSKGKIPGLDGPDGKLTETVAITLYLAKLHDRTRLFGSRGDLAQEAQVMSLVSWANQELLPTLARWFLPLIPNFSDPSPYDYDAIEVGKVDSLYLLEKLEARLAQGKWFVGDTITLADIYVAIYVSRGLEWVLGEDWRHSHPATMAHFNSVRNWGPVREVIPEFKLVNKEPENKNPYASNGQAN